MPALTSCRSLWLYRSPWPRLSRHMTTTQWFGSVFGVQVRPVLSPPAGVAQEAPEETGDTDTTDFTTAAARHSSAAAPEVLPTAVAFMASVGRLPPGTAPRRYFVPRELFDDLVGGVDAPALLPPAPPPTVAPSAASALLATAPSTESRSDVNLDLDAVAGAWPRAPDTTGAPPATHVAATGSQANKDAVYLRNLVRPRGGQRCGQRGSQRGSRRGSAGPPAVASGAVARVPSPRGEPRGERGGEWGDLRGRKRTAAHRPPKAQAKGRGHRDASRRLLFAASGRDGGHAPCDRGSRQHHSTRNNCPCHPQQHEYK